MIEKNIHPIEMIKDNSSENLEAPNPVTKIIKKAADFVTKAVLEKPEPIVFKDKDGSDVVIENRGGLWRL